MSDCYRFLQKLFIFLANFIETDQNHKFSSIFCLDKLIKAFFELSLVDFYSHLHLCYLRSFNETTVVYSPGRELSINLSLTKHGDGGHHALQKAVVEYFASAMMSWWIKLLGTMTLAVSTYSLVACPLNNM